MLDKFRSEQIVFFNGAFTNQTHIMFMTQFAERGSLDCIRKLQELPGWS